jgi:hypothetical protein
VRYCAVPSRGLDLLDASRRASSGHNTTFVPSRGVPTPHADLCVTYLDAVHCMYIHNNMVYGKGSTQTAECVLHVGTYCIHQSVLQGRESARSKLWPRRYLVKSTARFVSMNLVRRTNTELDVENDMRPCIESGFDPTLSFAGRYSRVWCAVLFVLSCTCTILHTMLGTWEIDLQCFLSRSAGGAAAAK